MHLQKLEAVINENPDSQRRGVKTRFIGEKREYLVISQKVANSELISFVRDVARKCFAPGVLGGFVFVRQKSEAKIRKNGKTVGVLIVEGLADQHVGVTFLPASDATVALEKAANLPKRGEGKIPKRGESKR